MEKRAEIGLKFAVGESPNAGAAAYRLFNNEFQLGDNSVFGELDTMIVTFLNYCVFNFVATRDERCNIYVYSNLSNLIRKSTQISEGGEIEPIKFLTGSVKE